MDIGCPDRKGIFMKKLKDWPLALQIWMVFTSVILIIFILLALYFSVTIKSFFTNETYKAIETAQEDLIQKSSNKLKRRI